METFAMTWLIFVLTGILFQYVLGDLVVQIKDGKVNGTSFDTPSGKSYYAWRSIPYAKPPIGNLRYLPPEKAEPWTNILDASKDSPACIFFGSFPPDPKPINGNSEDCLYINVYSPVAVGSNSSVDKVLPVLFWIYGGGLFTGFSDFGFYDPTPFLEENVIVVTFNYRLGFLGFLSTEDSVILGNAGFKDQVLALQWTKENIAYFGGDPLSVTIFGESAGAGSVGYHIVSPMSRNLFRAAIMQSGGALYGVKSNARDTAYYLASQVDFSITNGSTSAQVLDVLQKADTDLIIKVSSGLEAGAVMEIKSNLSFLTDPIYETIETGNIWKVPTIIGCNSEEMVNSLQNIDDSTKDARNYDSNPELLVPNLKLKENVTKKAIGEEIHQQYVGKNGSFGDNLAIYLEWLSDNSFVRSTIKHAILQSKFSPVYMYQFSYYGTLSKGNHLVIPGAGKVGHAEEVGYLFNVSTKTIKTEEDYLTRTRFVKLWTNFAKTTNPTPDDDSTAILQNVKWVPITQDNVQYLDIDNDLQMKPSRKVNETIFWDYIWGTYSYRPYNTF